MASTASDLLKLELQADNENDETWGALINALFERLEEAVAEMITITVTGANYTLDDTQYVKNSGSTAESHCAMIKTAGTLTGNRSVIVPDRNKQYLIWNTNSGAYTITVKTAAGAGIVVPQGFLQHVFCDGTNVEAAGPAFDVNGALVNATTSAPGVVEKSTSAENKVGTATGKYPDVAGVREILGIVKQNSQTGTYELVLTDAGKSIYHPSGGAVTWTIPANSSVAFTIGTAITFVNDSGSGGDLTIAITTDTMRLSPDGTTGSRTLAVDGIATVIKVTATKWMISGSGLT